ncbi:MAG: hypothetical protein WBZ45_00200 [Acidimicrobiia bacterium]
MRSLLCILSVALIVVACTGETADDGFRSTAPTFPPSFQTTTTSREPTGPLHGVLPDGTVFDLNLGVNPPEPVGAIFAVLFADTDRGSSMLLGAAGPERLVTDGPAKPYWQGESVFYLPAAGWLFRFYVTSEAKTVLGPDYRAEIEESIKPAGYLGYPVLRVSEPFRWSGDDETTSHTQVLYYSFVVRSGCGDLAVECSGAHPVQFIPIPRIDRDMIPWSGQTGLIEAYAPPLDDVRSMLDSAAVPR